MDTKKLDRWAELLLDTSRRNDLINFKDTKNATVEVLLPQIPTLFQKVLGSGSFEVFDPKIVDIEEELEQYTASKISALPETADSPAAPSTPVISAAFPADGKDEYFAQYSPKIKRQNQILLYNHSKNPVSALKEIDRKARTYLEETGVNVAFMAFGFIHWKETNSQEFNRAPILLVPIHLERASAVDPYLIQSAQEEVILNPTFAYKLQMDYNLELPEYDDEGLTEYLNQIKDKVSKLGWTVSEECKIGIFRSQKINMHQDLKDNSQAILANPNVRLLLGENTVADDLNVKAGIEAKTAAESKNPLIELHSVVDADSSQIEAIMMAKTGQSFVLQGPPGTGKSQTITNIIAECLSDGKKVLFVSEKLAALNVVYQKLKQADLADFCLELHSHKANKKDTIAELCRTLKTGKSRVSLKADAEIAAKQRAQQQLDSYAQELHKPQEVINESLYQLYQAHAAVRHEPYVEWPVPQLTSKGKEYLSQTEMLLEQYVEYIPSIGYDYRQNPWYGYTNPSSSYQTKTEVKNQLTAVMEMLELLEPIQHEIQEEYQVPCASLQEFHFWRTFFQFAATSQLLTPALLDRIKFTTAQTALSQLQELSADILATKAQLDAEYDSELYQLDGVKIYKQLTKQFQNSISRLVNAEYKSIISDLRMCKTDGKKPAYSEAVECTQKLAHLQQQNALYIQIEEPIKAWLGSAYTGVDSNWDYLNEQLSQLQIYLSKGISFGVLPKCTEFISHQTNFVLFSNKIDQTLALCETATLTGLTQQFDNQIVNFYTQPVTALLLKLKGCLQNIDKLGNWCSFRDLLIQLDKQQVLSYLAAVIAENVPENHIVGAFRKLFYFQWIDSLLSATPVLSSFSRISQDKAVSIFSEKDVDHFKINKAWIRAELSARRPSTELAAPGSAISILLRQGEKKTKQKTIRTLLMETGELVQRLKPCFLMSPLSVSTYLAPGAVEFDVVIFDEASQIFPQDAVGAIYRGKQLIVVGDSMQMPPSNFFNTSSDTDDSDEETGDIADFESILDLCSTSLQQLRLRWHYRSRYEQLITFSNTNFYDGDLVTFPAAKPDMPGIGVDYHHVDGIFDRSSKTNRKEAEYVVDLIYQHIEQYPERSLGVVAFSLNQADFINKLLEHRRFKSPQYEFFFKQDGAEPFFVKNLESVQGDERDTIIFSTAYGTDTQGRFIHNFGPLNRIGGERRLNVAVTRAKSHVQVVSSMHYLDIDLSRSKAEGVRLLREYLEYAEKGGPTDVESVAQVDLFERAENNFEQEICDFLRSHGFAVDTQVGCSGLKIDLAVRGSVGSEYVLAIECDGDTYKSARNTRDRDRLRKEVLENMGWKYYRIWSTDWFQNQSVEQERLLQVVKDAVS